MSQKKVVWNDWRVCKEAHEVLQSMAALDLLGLEQCVTIELDDSPKALRQFNDLRTVIKDQGGFIVRHGVKPELAEEFRGGRYTFWLES